MVTKYAYMTEEQKERRKKSGRKYLANRTEEQRERDKERLRQRWANMTEEQKQQKTERDRKTRANWPEERIEQELRKRGFRGARYRAKKKGLPFNLTLDYVKEIWPDDNKCRVFGTPFVRGKGTQCPTSPSIDRIEPAKGYTIGNVQVISRRANLIKNDATAAEVMVVAQYLLKKERERE